jgi:6-pyruvoyltetrahydropterin/6-carboxytetrahydropterin synthase
MTKIRVTKEFNFEMAHALKNYDGLCKNIHGHSYKLFVTVWGHPISDKNNPKYGMLIDFGDLKRLVNKVIVNVFDHALVLNRETGFDSGSSGHEMFGNTIYVNYQPTCENMVIDFSRRVKEILPDNIELFGMRLYETATSYAEWFAADNL